MSRKAKVKSLLKEFKNIPDYPDSPLSGWKHYGILKILEEQFQKELKRKGYSGRLVGLELTYHAGSDGYTMGYGYRFEEPDGEDTTEDPLSDDFVEQMFDLAGDLILENISLDAGKFNLDLSVSINPEVTSKDMTCMVATPANCSNTDCHGKCRKFRKRNNNTWECTHRQGPCRTC